MINFEDKAAIVTGAGTGIGFEIARELAKAGAGVVLNDIDQQVAENAARKIQDEGGQCVSVSGDASDIICIEHMIRLSIETFGQLDMVIANAGITTFGDFLEYELSQFQKLIQINLQGSFFLAQKAALRMIKQKTGGRILLMSSVTGHQAHPNLTAYGMTKAALEMLAKGLGVELAPHGITVNALAPGATLTERTQQDAGYQSTWNKLTPTGKTSTTADIAHAALFFLSDQSRQITGQTLIVDGGWTSVSPPPENT